MAPKKKQNEELEQQLLSLLKGTIGGMDKKIDNIIKRLGKLENTVFPGQLQNIKQLPPWYRDAALLKLLTLMVACLIIVLTIIASLRGIKLPGLFGVII